MPELRKYDLTVIKDRSGTDSAQVPAGSAMVYFHFQGADVRIGTTVTSGGTTVELDDVGYMKPGDTLEVFSASSYGSGDSLTVDSITDQDTAVLSGSDVAVSAGDRLLITARSAGDGFPRIYSDERMQTLLNTESGGLTTDANASTDSAGRLPPVYVAARSFDVVIDIGGSTDAVLIRSQEGGTLYAPTLEDDGVSFDGSTATATRNAIHLEDAFERMARSGATSQILAPKGTAYIDATIEMDKNNADAGGMELTGETASILKAKAGFADSQMFYISGAARHNILAFRGKTFDANSVSSLKALVLDRGVKEVWVERCRFLNVDGTALVLGRTGGTGTSLHVQRFFVNGNIFDTCGKGVGGANIAYGEICGNHFIAPDGIAIDLTVTSGDLLKYVTVDRNIIEYTTGSVVAVNVVGAETSESIGTNYMVAITNNMIEDTTAVGINCTGVPLAKISGNMMEDVKGGVFASYIYRGVIQGNSIRCNFGVNDGIDIENANGIAISGNSVYAAGLNGIVLDTVDRSSITGNVVNTCNDDGIELTANCDKNAIVGNVCFNNGPYGINIAAATCDSNLVDGNQLIDNAVAALNDSGTGTITEGQSQ